MIALPRRRLLAAALAAAAAGAALPAAAQPAWPARTVRIIVPFAAGSFTEVAARAVAAELTQQLGQSFIVETRGGAGSTLGTDAVAKSAPDGHTLLVTDNSLVVSPGLYAKLPYDPVRDLAPVSILAVAPATWSVRADLPAKTLRELVDAARAKPDDLTFGSGGQGSSAHLATELFLSSQGVKLRHIPFKGVAAALNDTAAGHVDLTVSSIATSLPLIKAGKLRALAISGRARHASLPEVPTFAEAGYPDYDMQYWFAMAAPGGTPGAIVSRLQQEVARALEAPKVREVFALQGAAVAGSSPAEMGGRVEREIAMWRGVIARAGVKVE